MDNTLMFFYQQNIYCNKQITKTNLYISKLLYGIHREVVFIFCHCNRNIHMTYFNLETSTSSITLFFCKGVLMQVTYSTYPWSHKWICTWKQKRPRKLLFGSRTLVPRQNQWYMIVKLKFRNISLRLTNLIALNLNKVGC